MMKIVFMLLILASSYLQAGHGIQGVYHSRYEFNNIALTTSPMTIWSSSDVMVNVFSMELSTRDVSVFIDYNNVNISSASLVSVFNQLQNAAAAGTRRMDWLVINTAVNDVDVEWFPVFENPIPFGSITIRVQSDTGVGPIIDAWAVSYFSTSTAPSGP